MRKSKIRKYPIVWWLFAQSLGIIVGGLMTILTENNLYLIVGACLGSVIGIILDIFLNRKKKQYMIFVLLIVLIMIALICNHPKFLKDNIEVSRWNGGTYAVCKANTYGESYKDGRYHVTAVSSRTGKEDIIDSNREAYIGEGTYMAQPASIFYHEDNYYALIKELDGWSIHTCYLNYQRDGMEAHAPCPVDLVISRWSDDEEVNTLDDLYKHCTFEEAKEFYRRISAKYVIIDDAKQQIILDAYDVDGEKELDKYVTLDFANKTVISYDKHGKQITINGTE